SALIFADVRVKHAHPLGAVRGVEGLSDEAKEVFGRGRADALILSGVATGAPADPEDFRRVREVLPDAPLVAGSGVNLDNLEEFWGVTDGMIVGSSLKEQGDARSPVDPDRARDFLTAAARLRRP
ncbi:MAG: hypothetical protein HKN12_08945, partial [Gemmatimonadetes bacterium]|nr:hypothetical protein [Gemmatimonadota bacterium]